MDWIWIGVPTTASLMVLNVLIVGFRSNFMLRSGISPMMNFFSFLVRASVARLFILYLLNHHNYPTHHHLC